jgi:hypothetical protein
MPPGGVVVVASDFYADSAALTEALRLFRSRRLELIGLQVLDPMELELSADNAGRFVDLEDGQSLPLNTAAVRDGYLKRMATFRRELTELFREQGAELVLQRTDANPLATLAAYLAGRARLL